MKKIATLFLFFGLFVGATLKEDFPQAQISNGLINAKFYLPDSEKGYYRASRFDWSGVIPALEYKGHNYFDVWNPAPYDPKLNDAITGPVEEFTPLGYDEAKVGETFVKIGVGTLKKMEDKPYRFFFTYDLINGGNWKVKRKKDQVSFTHELKDASGYSYLYTKTVRLVKGKPLMVLEHSLKNTGTKEINTSVYNHNFFIIDKERTGPNIKTTFPFELKAEDKGNGSLRGFGTIAAIQGKSIVFNRELNKGEQVYSSGLEGFRNTPEDYNITLENTKTGAGVKITSDQPLEKLVYWACPTTACPEPYVKLNVAPGKEITWVYNYEFFAPDSITK